MTTWILLRGLTREIGHWGTFPAVLRSVLGNAAVVAIDLPGAGEFHEQASPTHIEEIADHCHRQAIALQLQPPFNLVALSLGAMVAVAWARANPDEVAAAVLMNTSIRPYCRPWRRLRPRNYPSLLRLLFPATARNRESIILRLTSHERIDDDSIIDEWVALEERHPVALTSALRQLLAATRFRQDSPPAGTRLLVLASRGDTLVDCNCSRRLALAWRAEYAEHPTAGHDLPLDDGQWVAAQIADWWKKMETRTD
ncbi:MAG: alpha/beta hydrolase [Gammaproteobacteria bacterium]|nr:alpha/beta hydrolase [Gammaproteobacteria bacterium]MBU1415331.1 alpha/beta hydrolase [Gammaproteobacteria bacterium]